MGSKNSRVSLHSTYVGPGCVLHTGRGLGLSGSRA